MVLTSSRSILNNKENAQINPFLNVKFDGQGKLQRKRTHLPAKSTFIPPATRPSPRQSGQSDVFTSTARSLISLIKEVEDVQSSAASSQTRKLQLPKKLARPIFRPISKDSLIAVDPEFGEVPVDYIRETLRETSDRMYDAALKTTTNCPRGHLPRELQVVAGDMTTEIPTHVVAVYAETSQSQKQRISLYPTHSLVLAAHCAHLPPLPPSRTSNANEPFRSLPVVPLRLPSPRMFPLVLRYLYRHRVPDILSVFLPVSSPAMSREEISQRLAAAYTLPAILGLASMVHGFWSNIAALGVFEEPLWEAVDSSWATLIHALELKTGYGDAQQ